MYAFLRSLPYGNHGDYCAYADNDAKHSEKSTQFIASESGKRYSYEIEPCHLN